MKCAIFDLDGTLADTSEDLLDAANAQFAAEGYTHPLTLTEHRLVALNGGRAMLRAGAEVLGLSDIEGFANARYQDFLRHYAQNLDVKTQLYPDVVAVLTALRNEDWQLAVCTNKPTEMARAVLMALGILDYFESLIGAGSLDVVKPDPRMIAATLAPLGIAAKDAVLIGDSTTDYNTAKNAACGLVLVDFDGTAIGDTHPDAQIALSFTEVLGQLREMR